ncbi:helix-turn-helix domain-containing protein [Paenibacillaceae bacterium]|nr:helix-turn-helix domain-containing protein [Paenibacillaceae bacterium]
MSLKPFNLLTLHETMDLLGISRSTFDRWRRQKQLPFKKIGKEILVDRNELEQWIHQHSSILHNAGYLQESVRGLPSDQPLTIAVGYQSRSAQVWTSLVMKELGWFEEELANVLPGRNVNVNWVDAANGPELVQGMIGGHIHIASLGDYPIALSFSLSKVLPSFRPILLACDGKTVAGQGISLVVRNGIQMKSAAQIADLTISAVAQSSAGGRISKILHSLGIQDSQVLHKELDDSLSSMMKHEISGSVLGEPYISLAKYHGMGNVLFQGETEDDFLTGILVDERWAERNQAVAVAYLKAHIRVHYYVRTAPARAAELISRIRGVPAEVAASIIAKVRWDAALYEKDLTTLNLLNPEVERATGFFVENSGVQYRCEFLYQAMEALKLPVPSAGLLEGDWTPQQLY